MTFSVRFTFTRGLKADVRHEQTVAEYSARIRALEAELEQALNVPHAVDLAAERAKRRPETGVTA